MNPDASFNSRLFLSHVAFLQSQWPENRTLDYNTLRDLNNFCWRNGKWLEIPYVQAFFALHSQASLCESCSTSQILLAHSGPHPPNTMSPDHCSDFSSSFDPSDHSPSPTAPNPLAAAPDPLPQPPPYTPSLPPSQVRAVTTTTTTTYSSQPSSPACARGKL